MRSISMYGTVLVLVSMTGLAGCVKTSVAQAPVEINAAAFNATGQLHFPENTDRWITVGSGLGGTYESTEVAMDGPGTLSHVQMEPEAYEFFLENGFYAEGTMLLLTFFNVLEKPEPALRGFAQGNIAQREIHVIDARRFADEGRAFFIFPSDSTLPAAPLPVGSECVSCHAEHGEFDGTFTQFYPNIRSRLEGEHGP